MSDSSSTTSTLPLVSIAVEVGAVISRGGYWFSSRFGFYRPGPHERKVQTEARPSAAAVRDFYRSAVLLNNPVTHRQAQTRTLARRLGGEERIVDAVQVLRRNAGSRIRLLDFDRRFRRPCLHFQRTARRHGVARVHEKIEKYLLQLPCVSVNRAEIGFQLGLHLYTRFLKLVFEQ